MKAVIASVYPLPAGSFGMPGSVRHPACRPSWIYPEHPVRGAISGLKDLRYKFFAPLRLGDLQFFPVLALE